MEKNDKINSRRISPVQLKRYKKNKQNNALIEKINDNNNDNNTGLDISNLNDYLDELESKIESNSNTNEDLYRDLNNLKDKVDTFEYRLQIIEKTLKVLKPI
jgi:chromosome segregation ATPase